MIIGPKYKIARRLGAPVFEKTQTQKFAMSLARKQKSKRPAQKSDYGLQMLEKQKARYTYLLSEKQFSNYVKAASAKKGAQVTNSLFEALELRLDNVVYRMGLASTRAFARQVASHGHVMVNGKRVNIPSYRVSIGDKITIREGSAKKPLFQNIQEKIKNHTVPSWIKFNQTKVEAEIQGMPKLQGTDVLFDLNAVLEFYSR